MSNCPGCGIPYDKAPVHIIDTLPGSGLVPYCELCSRQLTLGDKKSHITSVINDWKAQGLEVDTVWQIALDTCDCEHFLQRRGKINA